MIAGESDLKHTLQHYEVTEGLEDEGRDERENRKKKKNFRISFTQRRASTVTDVTERTTRERRRKKKEEVVWYAPAW